MAFPADWSYRKSITLSRASGAVTYYQMKINVGESSGATGEDVDCGGSCKTDFSDLRFTLADGTTLLDYWIESVTGTTPNQTATVWVEFDAIGTGATTFYMYYGNAGAAAVSNGGTTFIGFYDFATSLNSGDWTTRSGSTDVTGTVLRVIGSTGRIETTAVFGTDIRACARMKYSTNTVYGMWGLYNAYGDERGAFYQPNYPYSNVQCTVSKLSSGGTTESQNAGDIGGDGAFHNWEIKRNGSTSVIFTFDGSTITTHSTYVSTTNSVFTIFSQGAQDQYCDWIFISKWLATEPAWGSWGEATYADGSPIAGGSVMNSHFFVMLLAGGGR